MLLTPDTSWYLQPLKKLASSQGDQKKKKSIPKCPDEGPQAPLLDTHGKISLVPCMFVQCGIELCGDPRSCVVSLAVALSSNLLYSSTVQDDPEILCRSDVQVFMFAYQPDSIFTNVSSKFISHQMLRRIRLL